MTEQRETLSALMDGEASEIEVHRLLRQMGENESLKETWLSWHQVRRIVQSPGNDQVLPIEQHLRLHRSIQQAIADEAPYQMKGGAVPRSFGVKRPMAGLAIAASLVVAVFVGMQVEQQTGGGAQPSELASVPGQSAAGGNPVITPRTVQTVANLATDSATLGSDGELDDGLRALDEEGQKRLRAYLQQHDQMARMKNNTSLVTYPGKQ